MSLLAKCRLLMLGLWAASLRRVEADGMRLLAAALIVAG
jgi:hypothetical protein